MNLHVNANQDAPGLAAPIRRGEVSAGEAHGAARRTISAVNPKINALAVVPFGSLLDYNSKARIISPCRQ